MRQQKLKLILVLCLGIFYGYFLTSPIDLTTADLGRHLKNGELVWSQPQLLWTNFYSYTYSNFPFINHHWGSGVVFSSVQKVFGFTGLSLFFLIIYLLTWWLSFRLAWLKGNFYAAVLCSILLLPLIIYRTEIRPEMFSYLFSLLLLTILLKVRDGIWMIKWLWLIPLLQLFWINLHIYFFLGLAIQMIFLLGATLNRQSKVASLSYRRYIILLALVLFVSGIISLANPSGIDGVLYPTRIFQNYGYRLLENQNLLFLEKVIQFPVGIYYQLSLGLLVLSLFWALYRQRRKFPLELGLIGVMVSVMSMTAVRNLTLFGFLALPVIAVCMKDVKLRLDSDLSKNYAFLGGILSVLMIILVLSPNFWQTKGNFWVGLAPVSQRSAQFFKVNHLPGPIFNNYDIGGYLIYNLAPQKVFVDNRPEAYPADFWQNIYIPMQQNETIWQQQLSKYNFQSIFFYRLDLTPWAQQFLVTRVKDADWAPVYVDAKTIIFVRRNNQNSSINSRFELPKEMFSTR